MSGHLPLREQSRDLRLWPSGLATWAGAALVVGGPLGPLVALALTAGLAALAAAALAVGRRLRSTGVPAPGSPAVLLCLIALLAGAGSAAVRAGVAEPMRLPDTGLEVRFEGVVDSDPRVIEPTVRGVARGSPRVVVDLTVTRMQWEGGGVEGRLPATAWMPVGASALVPGTQVAGRAEARPAAESDDRAAVLDLRVLPVVVSPPPWWQSAAAGLRSGLREATDGLPADGAALLPGLAIGDTSAMPPDLVDAMRAAGLAHLTAVSGANVTIVVGAAVGLVAALGGRRRVRAAGAILALAGFVILVRPSPSVVRASAMGGVTVLALLVGGRRRGPPALAAAVIALVLLDPWLSLSLGFALSAAATAGLLLMAPWLRRRLARLLPGPLADALAVTLAAQLATAPLLLLVAAPVGLGAIPANLLCEPVVAPATLLGLAATLIAPLSPAAAHVVAAPAVMCAQWVAMVARAVAGWAALPLPLPTGPAGAALTCVLGVGAVVAVRHRRQLLALPRAPVAAAAAVCAVVFAAVPRASTPWPPEGWRAVVCDVGQGDAVVLRAGEGSAVVVDAGPDPDRVDRCLDDLGVRQVPAVLLTHFHADHVEGLPGVLRGRDVGRVIVSPLAEPADEAERVARWCAGAGVGVEVVAAGDERRVGEAQWRLLWPARIIRGEGSDANNASLTALVVVGGVRLLLGADLEPASQAAVMGLSAPGSAGAPLSGAVGAVDVIKVPHHGSRRQNPRFGPWSGARAAIISVGADNDYGHPAPETVASYEQRGVAVRRTDLAGDVAVVELAGQVAVVGSRG